MLHFTQHFSYFCLRNLELQHIFSLADGKFSAPAAVYGPASANFSYGHTAAGGGLYSTVEIDGWNIQRNHVGKCCTDVERPQAS